MWRQVLVQYVARSTANDEPVGLVTAYGADPAIRFVHVGAVFTPPHTGAGLAAQVVLMIQVPSPRPATACRTGGGTSIRDAMAAPRSPRQEHR
jgi:hypothetical protein